MTIHKETTFPASPDRIYQLLTNGEKFTTATGMPAVIATGEGAAFSLFGGRIEGRQIDLISNERVVQAWRGSEWEPGVYSLVRFTLTPDGNGTRLTLDQDAYPDGASPLYPPWHEHLSAGWPMFYFEPFAKYLAGK